MGDQRMGIGNSFKYSFAIVLDSNSFNFLFIILIRFLLKMQLKGEKNHYHGRPKPTIVQILTPLPHFTDAHLHFITCSYLYSCVPNRPYHNSFYPSYILYCHFCFVLEQKLILRQDFLKKIVHRVVIVPFLMHILSILQCPWTKCFVSDQFFSVIASIPNL